MSYGQFKRYFWLDQTPHITKQSRREFWKSKTCVRPELDLKRKPSSFLWRVNWHSVMKSPLSKLPTDLVPRAILKTFLASFSPSFLLLLPKDRLGTRLSCPPIQFRSSKLNFPHSNHLLKAWFLIQGSGDMDFEKFFYNRILPIAWFASENLVQVHSWFAASPKSRPNISQTPELVLDYKWSQNLPTVLKQFYLWLVFNLHRSEILLSNRWFTGACYYIWNLLSFFNG